MVKFICMKILLLLTSVSTLLFLLQVHTTEVRSDFAQDYQGYLQTYDAYRSAHNRYITTRNQYFQYGTLTSQNEALSAVKQFLIVRDDVLLSYISLLRAKNPDPVYSQLLTDEESFLFAHKDRIPVISSLSDAERSAKEVEARHVQFHVTAKKLVATLFVNRIDETKLKFDLLANEAQTLMQALSTQGKDVSTLQRWLLDAKNKEFLSEQKILEARNQVASLQGNSSNQISERYNKIQLIIFEANQYMREAITYLNELSATIKYGDY